MRRFRQMLPFLVLVPSHLFPTEHLVFTTMRARTKPTSLIGQIKLSFNTTRSTNRWRARDDVNRIEKRVASFLGQADWVTFASGRVRIAIDLVT